MPHLNKKLGLRPMSVTPRLKLGAFLRPGELSIAPDELDWSQKTYSLMGNGTYGNCVPCAALNMIRDMRALNGEDIIFTDDDSLDLYAKLTGFRKDDPSTDMGTDPTVLFNYWRSEGIYGHKIIDTLSVDCGNITEVQEALAIFGPGLLGVNFPASAYEQKTWDLPETQPEGGHATEINAYSATLWGHACWGEKLSATWRFVTFTGYFCIFVLTEDWVDKAKKIAPNHLDIEALSKALGSVRAFGAL